MNKVTISKRELLEMETNAIHAPSSFNSELLVLLKNKGAPILGIVSLFPDMVNYNWNHYIDEFNHYISWYRKDKES